MATKEPCRDSDCPCIHGENVHGNVIQPARLALEDGTWSTSDAEILEICDCGYCVTGRARRAARTAGTALTREQALAEAIRVGSCSCSECLDIFVARGYVTTP